LSETHLATEEPSPNLAIHHLREMKSTFTGSKVQLSPIVESMSRQDIEHVFGAFGKVSDVDMRKHSGKTVVVTYVSRLDSEQAVENLDGSELHGVAVSVRHVD